MWVGNQMTGPQDSKGPSGEPELRGIRKTSRVELMGVGSRIASVSTSVGIESDLENTVHNIGLNGA